MRLVMMGTGPFAVPTFSGLFQTRHTVVALVTSPVRPPLPGKPALPAPVRRVAEQRGVEIFDPEDINREAAHLASFEADLFVVCDYGQILSSEALAAARLGGINLHASLLPRYRGAAPINWAIYHGEKETGVTVIHMTPRVDAGPCIAQARLEIRTDETAGQLEPRLADIGAWLIRRTFDSIEEGRLEALPQNPALASRAPKLKKTDGAVDWSRPAEAIRNQIRAMDPWPKTYTHWHRAKGQPLRFIVGAADVVDVIPAVEPGRVVEAAHGRLVISTGQGGLSPRTLQPAGKREQSIDELLRGYPIHPGDLFAPEK
jgi:methionyl-tRNA formyltransferase